MALGGGGGVDLSRHADHAGEEEIPWHDTGCLISLPGPGLAAPDTSWHWLSHAWWPVYTTIIRAKSYVLALA